MGFEAVHVGVDIGQKHDPTAVVACQVVTSASASLPTRYQVQHLERLELGTSYPDVAAHVVRVVGAIHTLLSRQRAQALALLAAEVKRTGEQVTMRRSGLPLPDVRLFVDATGVGLPVVDILTRALAQDARTRGVDLCPITFAAGETYHRETGRLGKAYLVSRLQALLQERRIKLPPLHPEAEAMARELKDYEIHVSAEATDTYGAFKVGSHDDLVTALGLSTLEDPAISGGRIRFFD